jgi:magnesium-transporting ATPase (P-type)
MDMREPHKPGLNKYDLNLMRGMGLASSIILGLNIIAFVVFKFTSPASVQSSRLWQTFAPIVAATAGISFVSLIIYNGIRSIGVYSGKNTFGSQIWLVVKRLTMFLFLPSIVLTALIILIAYIVSR